MLTRFYAPKYLSNEVVISPKIEPGLQTADSKNSENCNPHDFILPYIAHRGPIELFFEEEELHTRHNVP